ncbi:MAG: cytochrome c3 family protein [Ignavibacterium sp.]|jgi:hypothetical protein|uniref:cytochrome c3 family protein n=1 Tax=Ignavibacterium sp. TaxID=2651167 RepID=UPI003296B04E
MQYIIVVVIIIFGCNKESLPQACCSAGTPMLGSLETSTTTKSNLQLNLIYDYNILQSVFEGSTKIDDETRERITNSIWFETTYGLTDKLSFIVFFTFIYKRRIITTTSDSENLLSSSGIADLLLLIKSGLIFNHNFHLSKTGMNCETCHKGLDEVDYSWQAAGVNPPMENCYSCHNDKSVASNACESCHISTANLLPQLIRLPTLRETTNLLLKKLMLIV